MAGGDYYACDKCGGKTFYDADLQYGEHGDMLENPETKHPWPDGHIGGMAVICPTCAKEYKIEIVKVN